MYHRCPAPRCNEQVPQHMLMCATHWRLVPLWIGQEVSSSWRAGAAGAHARWVTMAVQAVTSLLDGKGTMPALTIRQPFASAIVSGPKRVENRAEAMVPRGLHCPKPAPRWVAVHAAKEWYPFQAGGLDAVREAWPEMGVLEEMPRAAVVGAAELVSADRWHPDDPDPWACGPWCLRIGRVLALPRPLPYRGAMGWWRLDVVTADALRAEFRATRSPKNAAR